MSFYKKKKIDKSNRHCWRKVTNFHLKIMLYSVYCINYACHFIRKRKLTKATGTVGEKWQIFTSKSWSSISPLRGKWGKKRASVTGILWSTLSTPLPAFPSLCLWWSFSRWELRDFSRTKLASGERLCKTQHCERKVTNFHLKIMLYSVYCINHACHFIRKRKLTKATGTVGEKWQIFTSKSWSSISPLRGKWGKKRASVTGILWSTLSTPLPAFPSLCLWSFSRWELRDFSRTKLASGERLCKTQAV